MLGSSETRRLLALANLHMSYCVVQCSAALCCVVQCCGEWLVVCKRLVCTVCVVSAGRANMRWVLIQ
eukprot:2110516-Alexandrium_andersonii.AAC.1